ncbi:DNA-binding transcriptional regulator, AcrR family [Nakamurella panacisegetis]|uniref:DNA-binding transcriptional regulator, AcrR family n=1 Tax=Nakamurella panacisegetis TaxID=1090615 RepID=A0A1H0R1W5_9ACTN|nr:TetR/AcrR family transcriptional regulator [Nakamurella panacisegetis]SDP23046.1 DNA-binding transcriptional regulator, AcrR family [Nakamurella panacisegetis]
MSAVEPAEIVPGRRRGGRRLHIVTAAADLFAAGGYPAAGMDQIGAAAGITGPAIYRHFDSKAAILAAVFDGIIDAVTQPPEGSSAEPDPARDLLALVGVYARAVASRRRLMGVFVREVHHLPPEHRIRLAERQRTLVRQWRSLLAEVHPSWSAEVIRATVHGCFGMLNALGTFDSALTDDELAGTLIDLARRMLVLD